MASLNDPRIRGLILEALGNGARGVHGYVTWKRLPGQWLRSALQGETQLSVVRRLLKHVQSGGKIDQVRERREEYASVVEFHYDYRLRIGSIDVYLETILKETRTGPVITVVSMHRQ